MGHEFNFNGIISILTDDGQLENFPYTTSKVQISLEDTIMKSFSDFNFSEDEKQKLSRHNRKLLYTYLSINPFELTQFANVLIKKINNHYSNYLIIEAEDYGAYIALAAIMSGKIYGHKKIELNLTNSPLALFPRNFMKKYNVANFKVNYMNKDKHWINQFKNLYYIQEIKFKQSA